MRFERLALRTPDSRVGMNHLYFRTGTWKGYNDFLEKVDISSEIVDSRVSFRTIAFFAPTLRNWQTVFEHVNGTVEGPVAATSGNLTRVDCRDTRVSVRFGMYGVPDIPLHALYVRRGFARNALRGGRGLYPRRCCRADAPACRCGAVAPDGPHLVYGTFRRPVPRFCGIGAAPAWIREMST